MRSGPGKGFGAGAAGGLQGGGRHGDDVGLQLEDTIFVGGAVSTLRVYRLDGHVQFAQRLLVGYELGMRRGSEPYREFEEEVGGRGELVGVEGGGGDELGGVLLLGVCHTVQGEGDDRGMTKVERSDSMAKIPLYGEDGMKCTTRLESFDITGFHIIVLANINR